MPIEITTNINDLLKKIESDIKGMMKSSEVGGAGKRAGQAIGRHIGDTLLGGNDSGYNYVQSGGLEALVQEESSNPELRQRQNDMTIGVFELNNMNDGVYSKRNDQFQQHEVWDEKQGEMVQKSIFLKGERQLPKWILAEFGSGDYKSGGYEKFDIGYTNRDKPYMYGPSIGSVGGPGGGRKKGYFMVTQSTLVTLLGPDRIKGMNTHREHEGIRAGHVFSKGLEISKQEVFEILGEGIEEYLKRVNGE